MSNLFPSGLSCSKRDARALLVGAVALLSGCSSFWPLSEDLEETIRAETAPLTPALDDHDAVLEVAEEAVAARAAPPDQFEIPSGAGLEDYLRLALERNPEIRARVRDLEALGMRVPQVTSLDDPLLAFVPPTGALTETAAGELQSAVGVSQKIPWPGKLATRGRIAEQVVRIGLENLRSARLAVVARVKRAYFSYYLSMASIAITRENEELMRHIRNVADAKFRAGTAPQQDLLRAEVELYELINDLLTLEQERDTAKALLNVLMDRAVEADLPVPTVFDAEAVAWKLDRLMERAVRANPELAAVRQRVQRDIEAIELARLEYVPDLVVGGGYGFIGGGLSPVATGRDVWNLTFGMTLPVWLQRIRAGIFERNAEALADALRYRNRRNEVFFAIQDALVRVDTRYRSAILLRDAIVPRARQTMEASESGYQSGSVDFLTWVDNWRRLLDFNLQYHAALAALEQEFAALEEVAGGELARSAEEDRLPAGATTSKRAAGNETASKENGSPERDKTTGTNPESGKTSES